MKNDRMEDCCCCCGGGSGALFVEGSDMARLILCIMNVFMDA